MIGVVTLTSKILFILVCTGFWHPPEAAVATRMATSPRPIRRCAERELQRGKAAVIILPPNGLTSQFRYYSKKNFIIVNQKNRHIRAAPEGADESVSTAPRGSDGIW